MRRTRRSISSNGAARLPEIVAFLQVVETGSVSAAAEHLNLAKSVVSKRVNDLEMELGVELFHRSTRKMTPTDDAVAYAKRVCDILRDLEEATEQVANDGGDMHGELRIAASASFGARCLGPILLPFMARYPRLEVTIHLDDRVFDQTGDGYDLAVRMGRPRSLSLVSRKIGLSRRLVCCSPDYAQRAGVPATVDDIAGHSCIGYSNMPPALVWQFEAAARGAVAAPSRSATG